MGKKIAAVFAGQGAQFPGMGKSLYENSAAARAVFEVAGDKITRDCFEASQEELNQTDVTQPAVYTVDMAAWAAFSEALDIGGTSGSADTDSVEIVGMAGFSLGEYAAFTAAGIIPDIADGIGLIRERGRLMAAAGRHEDGSPRGAMAAVLGSRDDIMELVCKARGKWVLEAVNFNAPTQTVIAGDAEAIKSFATNAKDSGKKLRVMPLPVSTAFHSPIMAPASQGIRDAALIYSFSWPSHEIYLDMTGKSFSEYILGIYGDAKRKPVRNLANAALSVLSLGQIDLAADREPNISLIMPNIMAEQVKSPVKWQQIIEALVVDGADIIVEFGPGKTLTGLAKKIAPSVTAVNVQDAETLALAIEAIEAIERI